MAPTRESCQVLHDVLKAQAEALAAWKKIVATIDTITHTAYNIRFGIVDAADVVGSELVAAASAAAASIAATVATAITSAAASLIEAILSQVLKILLVAPTALFSIVAIPQQQAQKAALAEARKLEAARSNMGIVLKIIAKWLGGYGGEKFYNQIVQALPYIISAIEKNQHVINELEGEPTTLGYSGNGRNSFFDEGTFNSMKSDIESAESILKPKSAILDTSKILDVANTNAANKRSRAISAVNAKYDAERKVADQQYASEVITIQNGDTLQGILRKEKAAAAWAAKIKFIESHKKMDLVKVEAESAASKVLDLKANVSFVGLQEEFLRDMQTLLDNLNDFVNNMTTAFESYKVCQLACHTAHNTQALVSIIIQDIIAMLRTSGNAAADAVIADLQSIQALLTVARNRLATIKDDYEQPGAKKPSSTQMALEITGSYTVVSAADNLANATITRSLIDLINADETVLKADEDFNKFIERLYSISDWDGSKGWIDNLASVAPYVNILADSAALLFKIPAIGFSNSADDKASVKASINSINAQFGQLIRHNSEVSAALNSYAPYIGTEAGNLLRILSNAGLLQAFATSLDIATLISDIVASTSGVLNSEFPTRASCSIYEDIFPSDDTTISGIDYMDKANKPSPATDVQYASNVYKNSELVSMTRQEVFSTNYFSTGNDKLSE